MTGMGQQRSFPAVVAAAVIFFLSSMAVAATVVDHTFVVSQVNMTRLCNETLVTVVNGQLPGPMIEVKEGDSVAVHVVNKSPYNITIHWHGVKQRLNCWADGVPMITQCPIRPGHNFTYRFNVAGQQGTLWWHAHVSSLRASVHGALIIRPRQGDSSYPFPKPHREIPIIIGEWWETDLVQMARNLTDGYFGFNPVAATLNGKLGDLYNCSGAMEDGYVLDVDPGKTYLLRFINAVLSSEHYLKIAGHKLTVVAADANYVNPYTTDTIAIAPGQTLDVLLVADASPGSYYMVSMGSQPTVANPSPPAIATRGTVQYRSSSGNGVALLPPMVPDMPDLHDTATSFSFHGHLTSLHRSRVPTHVDEHLLILLSAGSTCRRGRRSCKRSGNMESSVLVTMNNISFEFPTTPLLEAHYHHRDEPAYATLPDRPQKAFDFTDPGLIPFGPKEAALEPTVKATTARRFRHGSTVEVVFQDTAVMQRDYNPIHLHGHDMFVVAQGLGNYDAARDVARYNLVDPHLRNTVLVPSLGWTAVRFVTDNPGVWYIHCHYEYHITIGMATVFIVEDGPTVSSSIPPPSVDLPKCYNTRH